MDKVLWEAGCWSRKHSGGLSSRTSLDVPQPDRFQRGASRPRAPQGAILSQSLDEITQVQMLCQLCDSEPLSASLCSGRTPSLCLPELQGEFHKASSPATSTPSFQTPFLGLQGGSQTSLSSCRFQSQETMVLVGRRVKLQ